MSQKPIDLSKLKLSDLDLRPSKVAAAMLGKPWQPGGSFRQFIESLPQVLAADDLRAAAGAIVAARRAGRPVILGMGAHVIKVGLSPLIMLVNSDVLATAPAPELLQTLKDEDAVAVLGLVDEARFNTVALDQADRVLGFQGQEGLSPARWLTYSGLAALSPRLLDYLPSSGRSSLVEGLRAAIVGGEKVLGRPLAGFWDDLGTPERLIMLHRLLAHEPPQGLRGLSPEGPVLLGPGARLENGVQVKGFAVLGAGAVAEAGSFLHETVLLPGARVAAGAVVERTVLGDGFVATGRIQGGAHA